MADQALEGINAFGALQNQARQRMAYNALVNAYGPQAADPEAWGQAVTARTNELLQPGAVPAQAATTAEAQQRARYTGAQADTSAALLPGAVPAQAAETSERNANAGRITAETAEIAPNSASTRSLQEQQGNLYGSETQINRLKAPFIQELTKAGINKDNAEAAWQRANAAHAAAETAQIPANAEAERGLKGAQTGYAQAEAARTNQQSDDARRASQQAQALSVVNGAIAERDNPHAGNFVQTPGQRAASFLSRLSPDTWAAMGVDPQHIEAMKQHVIQHPEDLDNFASQLTGATTGLTQGGLQAAASMVEKGEPVSFGMGKQATAIRSRVMNLVAQDMKAGGGSAADAGGVIQDAKARQKYVSDLSGTSPTSAGGKVQSANALLNHLDLLSEYSEQLNNGTFRKGNDLSQALTREFGGVPPAQFEAQRNIVADELGRFLIARGGSTADREALKSEISRAASPAQLRAVIAAYRSDMVGQLQSMAQQAHANGADSQFTAHLTPRVRGLLSQHSAPAATSGFKYLGKE